MTIVDGIRIAACDHGVALDLPCPRCSPDPLQVSDEPWIAVTSCANCGASLLGEGRLLHLGRGFHEWDPMRAESRSGWLPMAAALVLLAAVVGYTVRPWEWLR